MRLLYAIQHHSILAFTINLSSEILFVLMVTDILLLATLAGIMALIAYVGSIVVGFYKQDQISRSNPFSEGQEASYKFDVSYDEAEAYEKSKQELLNQVSGNDGGRPESSHPARFKELVKSLPDSDRVSLLTLYFSTFRKN